MPIISLSCDNEIEGTKLDSPVSYDRYQLIRLSEFKLFDLI